MVDVIKLSKLRLMNQLDGDKELVWKVQHDKELSQFRKKVQELEDTQTADECDGNQLRNKLKAIEEGIHSLYNFRTEKGMELSLKQVNYLLRIVEDR